ncbi:MAG: hypothetical protein MJ168_07915 [Clostridia bacterium]|nr:hypothetical protein [Clostridia bacterium]
MINAGNSVSNYYKRPPFIWWDLETQISFLQRRIIVYSIAYYDLNENIVSDRDYDNQCKLLVKLMQKADVKQLKKTDYNYCMFDFDGTTGFDLRDRLTKKDREKLTKSAQFIITLKGGG